MRHKQTPFRKGSPRPRLFSGASVRPSPHMCSRLTALGLVEKCSLLGPLYHLSQKVGGGRSRSSKCCKGSWEARARGPLPNTSEWPAEASCAYPASSRVTVGTGHQALSWLLTQEHPEANHLPRLESFVEPVRLEKSVAWPWSFSCTCGRILSVVVRVCPDEPSFAWEATLTLWQGGPVPCSPRCERGAHLGEQSLLSSPGGCAWCPQCGWCRTGLTTALAEGRPGF